MALSAADNGWNTYGGDAAGTRFSALKQVTRENVAKLRPVWTYHTGALKPETELNEKAAFEATAILVDGTLYLTTPFNRVIALDPASGAEKWTYDPKVDRSHDYSEVTSRGVAFWSDSKAAADAPCKLRIFEGTIDARLIGIDGKTGKAVRGFRRRRHGESDSRSGLRTGVPRQLSGHVRAHRSRGSGHHRLFDCRQRRGGHAPRSGAGIRRAYRGIAVDVGSDPLGGEAAGANRRVPTHGRPLRPTRRATWCSFPPAARVPIITAGRGPATTSGRIRWSL